MRVKKIKLSRRYEDDIFGDIVIKAKNNKVTNFFQKLYREKEERKKQFVFRIDVVQPKRKRVRYSQYGKILRDLKKICVFYGGIKRTHLYKVIKLAKTKKGNLSDIVISNLEMRLEVVLYRMNFASSVKEGRQLIKEGVVSVNKEVIRLVNVIVNEGDLIEILEPKKEKVYNNLIKRLKKKWIYTSLPKYLEVNYKIMCGCVIKKPVIKEVALPFSLEYDFFSKLDVSRV